MTSLDSVNRPSVNVSVPFESERVPKRAGQAALDGKKEAALHSLLDQIVAAVGQAASQGLRTQTRTHFQQGRLIHFGDFLL